MLAATCLVALGAGRPAEADEARGRTSSLSWVRLPGADTCVATQDLAKLVEARLGRAAFVSAALADVSIEGHIEPDPGRGHHGFRAVLTLRDAHGALLGSRELARPEATCDGMRDPLALVIAIMIDPDAALGAKEKLPPAASPLPAPVPVLVDKPLSIAVTSAVPPPEPPPLAAKPKPGWQIDVGASAISTVGSLPAPNVGVSTSSLLQPPGLFPLEGFGALWFDDTARRGSGSASFLLAYVGGGLCPLHYERARVRLYGCAIGELGFFVATPAGASATTHPYLAGGAESRVSVMLAGPVAARVGLRGTVPLFRPDTYDGTTEVFRPAVVAAAADLGLGVLLP